VEDDDDEEEEEEGEEDDINEESESEDGKVEKEDICDLERTIQEIQNVKLNDSQEIKNKMEGDTSLVCYLEG
jgi:hypothetical protein